MIKKLCVATTLALLAVGCDSAQDKCYQIVVTPEKEYYTTFYLVDLDSSCPLLFGCSLGKSGCCHGLQAG